MSRPISTINGAASVAWAMTDAAELIWNTYGVGSKVGRLAERSHHRAHELACELGDPPAPRQLPNRFVFADYKRGQPRQMSREQHAALGTEFKRCERIISLRRTAKAWTRLAKIVSKLKWELDSLALMEDASPEACSWYGRTAQ